MNLETANETDVREDIAMPILTALGYVRGTANDIRREFPLKYERQALGRKKPSDPPLRGKPDYVMIVTGAGRWVLEVKAPNVEIQQSEVEQTITYARHPEVAATYVVVLNGRRLVVYHYTQLSSEDPLLDFEIKSPAAAARMLLGTLSPAAIRRECKPTAIDTDLPLAEGLRSSAEVRSGLIEYLDYRWHSNLVLPKEFAEQQEVVRRAMLDYRTEITGGRVWRDSDQRIKATLMWAMPHKDLLQFAIDKKLLEAEYVALDETLSTNSDEPTLFDVIGDVSIEEGEPVFDISRFQTDFAGASAKMTFRGQAAGYFEDFVFHGGFQSVYLCTYPAAPGIEIYLFVDGRFEVKIDDR